MNVCSYSNHWCLIGRDGFRHSCFLHEGVCIDHYCWFWLGRIVHRWVLGFKGPLLFDTKPRARHQHSASIIKLVDSGSSWDPRLMETSLQNPLRVQQCRMDPNSRIPEEKIPLFFFTENMILMIIYKYLRQI